MISCPTCNNKNEAHERHCLRCGRPLADIAPQEEHDEQARTLAIKLEDDAPGLLIAGDDDTQDDGAMNDGVQDDDDTLNSLQGMVAIKVDRAAHHRATLVEHLEAVPSPEPELPVQSQGQGRKKSDTQPEGGKTVIASITGPGDSKNTKPTAMRKLWGMFAVVLLLLSAAGAGMFHLMTAEQDGAEETEALPRILIGGGPFLKGLSNDYRLMFSETCRKISDHPDTECKEEIALKDEVPQQTIELTDFWLDALEVSNQEWTSCVKAKVCAKIDYSKCENHTLQGLVPFLRVAETLKKPNRPVICVNRREATSFCTWRGGRLPSGDEWEKAARGKNAYLFPWGSNWNPVVANWAEQDMARVSIAGMLDGHIETAPVHSMPEGRAPSGAHHMAGNVSEWVAPPKGQDKELLGTGRGGSWLSNPTQLRTTGRLTINVDKRRSDLGLRCAYDEEAPP